MEVHRQLGPGFVEATYQEALAIEFTKRNIPFEKEKSFDIFYNGVRLSRTYSPDFICFNELIVELKAISCIGALEIAQVLGYIKATGIRKAIILNFGETSLRYKSLIN